MLELFGNKDEIIKDYIKHDRLRDFIDEDCELAISIKSEANAKNAVRWSREHGLNDTNIREFVSKYCDIEETDRSDTNAYSDIRFPANTINLYNNRLKEVYISLKDERISYCRVVDIFILHEFYHYIEVNEFIDIQSMKVNTYGFGKWKVSANVDAVSEVSATFFVREIVKDVKEFFKERGAEIYGI